MHHPRPPQGPCGGLPVSEPHSASLGAARDQSSEREPQTQGLEEGPQCALHTQPSRILSPPGSIFLVPPRTATHWVSPLMLTSTPSPGSSRLPFTLCLYLVTHKAWRPYSVPGSSGQWGHICEQSHCSAGPGSVELTEHGNPHPTTPLFPPLPPHDQPTRVNFWHSSGASKTLPSNWPGTQSG